MLRDFDRVRALDETALRALLEGPDARDRLWAVWALALKKGAGALAPHLAEEPSAGVRRHMCIVLAGGELDLLVAMARFDPDDGVRATASGLVARLAGGGRLPWSLALERLDDPAARTAVLRELTPLAPEELVHAARRIAEDPDREVALEALDALFRIEPASAAALVAERLGRADERECYALLTMWTKHASASVIHEALRTASIEARLAAVQHFAARWSDVAVVAMDADVRLRAAVRKTFLGRLGSVSIDALASWLDEDLDCSWPIANAILERLRAGESLPAGTGLLARCRRRLASLAASLPSEAEETALALRDEDRYEDDDDDVYDERACLQLLIETIESVN